ncbi:MAG: DNA repair protein RecO [Lachnospirales bacterium]
MEKIRGIIIRENEYGEADKYITIFAKNIGKISVFAKGARNTKSKFLAGTSIFTYGDFVIRTQTNTPTLNSVDIIEKFYDITSDLDKYYYGTYLLEFILKIIPEITDDNKYLILLLKTLNHLKICKNPSILIIRIFQIKMLKYLGYNPYNEYCTICGTPNPNIFTLNGLICNKCSSFKNTETLLPVTIYALKYISESDVSDLFKFNISNECLKELGYIAEEYISNHIGVKLKSYSFINT